MSIRLLQGDALEQLRTLPAESVHCVVTSPPYWGLRDYGVAGQLGLESTPEEYVAKMVAVFSEVRRVLRKDGTLWLNMGDCYAANRGYQVPDSKHVDVGNSRGSRTTRLANGRKDQDAVLRNKDPGAPPPPLEFPGLKPKDLVGMPWRLAFALQGDGWWLRADIIWSKPNPMPESVTDRPTKAHEYLFLLSRSPRYFYDAQAIAEPAVKVGQVLHSYGTGAKDRLDANGVNDRRTRIGLANWNQPVPENRNARSVWTIATVPFPEAHFATFPPELARRCIAAGSRPGDTILDPFAGAGTTLLVADRLGRDAVGIDLNPEYVELARRRIQDDAPLFFEECL